jgi:hypothetical protein
MKDTTTDLLTNGLEPRFFSKKITLPKEGGLPVKKF